MGRLTHTVNGDVASFRAASRVPIESLKFHFLPKQASGTPSPENPIPIEGWTGLNGVRSKKNLIKPYYTNVTTISDLIITPTEKGVRVQGTASAEQAIRLSSQDIRFLDEGKKYTFSLYVNGDISGCKDPYIGYFDGVSYWGTMCSLTQQNNYKFTWTVPNRYATAIAPWFDMYIRVKEGSTVDFEIGLQMEAGEKATDYEPFSGGQIPITFPSNGKNLYDALTYPLTQGYILWSTDGTISSGYAQFATVLSFVPCENIAGKTVTLNKRSGGIWPGFSFYSSNTVESYLSGLKNNGGEAGTPWTFTVPKNAKYMRFTVPANTTDIQIELGTESTSFEPYSSDNTFYGGYVDPVAGEIVAEYGLFQTTWGEGSTGTVLGDTKRRGFYVSSIMFADAIDLHNNGQGPYGKYRRTLCNVVPWGWNYFSDYPHYYINNHDINLMMPVDTSDDTVIQFCAWLKTPIHIPIPAEDMKAFLDHNNFWSDANDVTEVTYPVTESRDILATRKLIMSQTWDMIPLKYQPVEYISAKNSNPYIDMGIQFTSELEAEVHYYNDKGEAFLFGARKSASNSPYCNFNVESPSSSSAGRSRFDYGNRKATATSGLPFAGYHDGEYIFKFHNRAATMEKVSTGEVVTKEYNDVVRTDYPNYNMYLFSVNTAGTASLNTGTGELRVYSAKFWLGGQLVRDFVPCVRKSDSKPGMYDRVSKTFFTNVGSGEFVIPT